MDENGESDNSGFINDVKQSIIKISDFDFKCLTSTHIKTLDHLVEGKNIVFLGESNHWVTEKFKFRLFFMEYLVSKGFDTIGLEMGRSDGRRINSFLQTGNTEFLEKIALYGYRGFKPPPEKKEEIKGLFAGAKSNLEELKSEDFNFFMELRKIYQKKPFDFFGFDIDTVPGGFYEDFEHLENFSGFPEISVLADLIHRAKQSYGTEEIEAVTELLGYIENNSLKLTEILSEELFSDLLPSTVNFLESLRFNKVLFNHEKIEELLEAYPVREKTMYREVEKALENSKNKKVILMGHNMHLLKDHRAFKFGKVNEPGGKPWYVLGSYLHDTYPEKVCSFWFTYYYGEQLHPISADRINPDTGKTEYLFSKAGNCFMLPLDSKAGYFTCLDKNRNYSYDGEYCSGNITKQADLIFFVNKVNKIKKT